MDISSLAQSPLFNGIDPAGIQDILSVIPHRTKRFCSGSMISQSGDPVDSLMIVTEGIVKGEMIDYSGRIIKIEEIAAPGALAPAFLFGRLNRFPVNVIATTEAEILFIEKADFLKLMMTNRTILANFLDIISNHSQFLSEKIKFLNFKTIRAKLAQYILHISGNGKNGFRLDRTQNDLADFFGVARPSIARTLNEMEKDGHIEARGKNIRILNREGLAKLTSE